MAFQSCDWGALMTVLDYDRSAVQKMRAVFGDAVPDVRILASWYRLMDEPKKVVKFKKRVLKPQELKDRGRKIYDQVIRECGCDAEVLRIHDMTKHGPPICKKVSGRTIDTLVTRYPKYSDVCYYLDMSGPKPRIADTGVLFDIGVSYKQKMHQFSKAYFDCFGRGDLVEHTLSTGGSVVLSLCQFTFFMWADRFCVFEFLEREYENIVTVRQYSQNNTYTPKKKPKRHIHVKKDLQPSHYVPSPAKRRKPGRSSVVLLPKKKKKRREPALKPLYVYALKKNF